MCFASSPVLTSQSAADQVPRFKTLAKRTKRNKMEITYYPSVKAVDQKMVTTIQSWIQQIKDPGIYKGIIEQARQYRTTNEKLYKRTKTESLPVFMPNFTYTGARNDKNLSRSTGLLYFDYDCGEPDCAEDLKHEIITKPYVYAAWKSLSATGLGVLVRVSAMPSDKKEFAQAYQEIGDELGLHGWDPAACNRGRCNVLSYDQYAYLNEGALSFNVKEKVTSNLTTTPVCSDFLFLDEVAESGKNRLITKAQLAFYSSDCVYIEGGNDYYSCFVPFGQDGRPKKIGTGQRQAILSAFCHNLVCLNRTASEYQILSLMKAINSYHCTTPLTLTELVSIVKTKHTRRQTLVPIGITNKKYWVRPGVSGALSAYHTAKRERSLELVFEFFGDSLLNIEHKVTNYTIRDFTGLSLPTIRSIIKEHPEMSIEIKDHNQKVKKRKSLQTGVEVQVTSDFLFLKNRKNN